MGWVITLGILILLAVLPLGVSVRYDEDGLLVRIIAGPVKLTVFPRRKKEKKKLKEAAPAEEKQEPAPKAEKTAKEKPKAAPKEKSGGRLTDFLPLVRIALDFLGDLRRKLRVNVLELKLVLAGDDPCDLATNYGRAWAAVGNLWPRLERLFVIEKRDVNIECDFTAAETLVTARLDLTMTLGRLLGAVFTFAFRALFAFLKIMNQRKGGADNEPKST